MPQMWQPRATSWRVFKDVSNAGAFKVDISGGSMATRLVIVCPREMAWCTGSDVGSTGDSRDATQLHEAKNPVTVHMTSDSRTNHAMFKMG